MSRTLLSSVMIAAAVAAPLAPAGAQAAAKAAPEITITRLQCGTNAAPTDVGQRFSDTYAFHGLMVQLTFSCYLVRHGDDYLVWDTGNPVGTAPTSPKTSLVDLLARLKVAPAQVKFVAISHYHADHTGQASEFPQATLLIGKGDWDVLTDPKAAAIASPAPFAHWIGGGGKVEPVSGDRDVFGDGTVVMLNTPGHTPDITACSCASGRWATCSSRVTSRTSARTTRGTACRPSTPIAPRRSLRSSGSSRSRRT